MKIVVVKLAGGCMRPLLRNGQTVLIIPPRKKLYLGDLVLYKIAEQLFLHRVVKLSSQSVVVNDDCGITSYITVPLKDVIGICPTILSGFLGYIYHIFIRTIYTTFRWIKKLLL